MRTLKASDKYRFTLQWGAKTAEKIQAGDFLESLGNRKSELVVLAVAEYLSTHPDAFIAGQKPKIIVKPSYTREQVEALVRSVIEEKMSGSFQNMRETGSQSAGPDTIEPDVDEMLKNLELF